MFLNSNSRTHQFRCNFKLSCFGDYRLRLLILSDCIFHTFHYFLSVLFHLNLFSRSFFGGGNPNIIKFKDSKKGRQKKYVTWKNLLINTEGLLNQFKIKINLNPYNIWKVILRLQLEKLYFNLEKFDFFCYTKANVYLHSELYTTHPPNNYFRVFINCTVILFKHFVQAFFLQYKSYNIKMQYKPYNIDKFQGVYSASLFLGIFSKNFFLSNFPF